MRTRIFNKMTGAEVEEYLARGGRTIFVATGAVEVHGAMPIDCEAVFPEAMGLAMAEAVDGLVMINLPYFFPGGTVISNATVQVSVQESISWLATIARSLVSQGFDRIILLSGHAPASVYAEAMCRDFFQQTKIHVCYLSMMKMMRQYGGETPASFSTLLCGAYKMLHQMEYLPVDPDAQPMEAVPVRPDSPLGALQEALRPFGGRASLYYETAAQHFAGRAFRSEAERLAVCEEGERAIHDMVQRMAPDLQQLLEALDRYHRFVQEIIVKYPHAR